MVVELHFRKADYEKYDDFQKLDIAGAEDMRTTIALPVKLYPLYNYLMKKLRNRKIVLYSVTKEGDKDFYSVLDPPHLSLIHI